MKAGCPRSVPSDLESHEPTSAASPHPLPKFTSRQRTIITWDAFTRTNPPPNICPSRLPKSRPPTPPLYPMGVCFQPPAASPMVQNQQLTERVHRFAKGKRAAIRSLFGPIRGYFAPFLAFFAGLRRSARGGTTPSRSAIIARRQREQQPGWGLDYPSWLTFTCNAAKSTVPSPRAAAICK
jgi:hypothetical protein